jgi:histidine triad (HIT) family protein
MDCLFCKIINDEIPCFKIYENDFVLAFLDINPDCDGHTLIIPKKHFVDLNDIEENVAIAQEMMRRNIFQSAYSFNKQQAGFDTDEIMRQFGYRIEGGKDPKSWKSRARNIGLWWTRFGEEQEAVTKIVAYLYELKKGTGAEEASRIAIERGGTPNLAARGVAASYIENATGFFWNVRKEGTLRTLRAIKDHPTEWITKNFAQTAMPAFLKCMIITGGLEMIIRAMFDDDEEKIQNSWWAGEVVNYARFMNSAMKCVPGYYQRNYNIIPIAKFGDEVLSMRIKYSPEEFAIQNAIHTAFQKFGADPTDPDADWSSFNKEMLSQITPDIFGGNYALDLAQILIGPIIGYNPYDRYRQRNVYDNSTWEARWSAPGNMATAMVTNFANYSPFGSFVTRFKDGQEQKIEDSDVPAWLDAVLQTPLLSRIPASMLSITSSDSYLKALANVDSKQKAYARIVAGDLLAECIENGRLGGFEEGLKDLPPELKRLAIRHVLNGWRQFHMDPNAKKLRTMRRIKDPNLKRKARKWIEDAEKYGD